MTGKQAKRARAAARQLAADGEDPRAAEKRTKQAVRDSAEMPVEADPTSVRVPLPNKNWVRSVKRPNWSICFDPNDNCFGWKMQESEDKTHWVEGGPLSLPEIEIALTMPSLADFTSHLRLLRKRLEKNDPVQTNNQARP